MKFETLFPSNPFRKVKERYWGNKMNEQRLTLMLFVSTGILVGTFMTFTGLLDDSPMSNTIANIVAFVLVVVVNLLFLFGRIKLIYAVGMVFAIAQITLNFGIVCFSLPGPFFNDQHAMADISIALIISICSVHAYLRYTSTFVCLSTLICYLASIHFTPSAFLVSYFPFFIALAIAGLGLGYVLVHNVSQIYDEKVHYEQESQRLSRSLKFSPEQLNALMELAANEPPSAERQKELFGMLGINIRKCLFDRVQEIIQTRELQTDVLQRVLPGLTESEIEICRLVLSGKRLTEICVTLNKTKSNITCQRSHIRAKLGLSPEEDLKEALKQRMQGALE